MKAYWKEQLIAESEETDLVEGNYYFPAESVKSEFLQDSDHHSHCPWKGEASYYHITVDGDRNENAAWYYPQTKPLANHIRGKVAFWKGVEVREN